MDAQFQADVLATVIDLRLARYAELSGATLIVYDHLITLPQEIALIWTRRHTLGKSLFLLIRYHNLFAMAFHLSVLFNPNPSNKLCNIWLQWQTSLGIIIFVLTETVLQMRIYAMYGGSKKILALILSAFLICTIATCVLLAIDLEFSAFTAFPLPGGNICYGSKKWGPFYVFWIPIICYESLLFGLALFKGHQTFKDGLLGDAWGMMIRDSILYFAVIFTTYFVNLLIWVMDPDLAELPVTFVIAMPTIMCERLLLNIREIGQPRETYSSSSVWPQYNSSSTKSTVFQSITTYSTDIELPVSDELVS